MGNTDLSQLRG